MKKFKITGEVKVLESGVVLHRIMALRDIMTIPNVGKVKSGSLGGWIEREGNLAKDGEAWVAEEACVYGDARVTGMALVAGRARVSGHARVGGAALVSGDATVTDHARVAGKARVTGNARVDMVARVSGSARLFGVAREPGAPRFGERRSANGIAGRWHKESTLRK